MRFARLAVAAIGPFFVAGLTSCSDPVPPTPQGAWSVSFQSPDSNPSQCQVAGHNSLVGSVTADKRDSVLPDGVSDAGDSASVDCSVVGSSKFDVHGRMTQADKGLEITIKGITAAATEMSPAPGTGSYAALQTAGEAYSSTPTSPCQFFFTPNTPEGIAAGRIWVAFKCPGILDSATMSICQIKQGFAIFENCTQTAASM